jgi:hypothetical protein
LLVASRTHQGDSCRAHYPYRVTIPVCRSCWSLVSPALGVPCREAAAGPPVVKMADSSMAGQVRDMTIDSCNTRTYTCVARRVPITGCACSRLNTDAFIAQMCYRDIVKGHLCGYVLGGLAMCPACVASPPCRTCMAPRLHMTSPHAHVSYPDRLTHQWQVRRSSHCETHLQVPAGSRSPPSQLPPHQVQGAPPSCSNVKQQLVQDQMSEVHRWLLTHPCVYETS